MHSPSKATHPRSNVHHQSRFAGPPVSAPHNTGQERQDGRMAGWQDDGELDAQRREGRGAGGAKCDEMRGQSLNPKP